MSNKTGTTEMMTVDTVCRSNRDSEAYAGKSRRMKLYERIGFFQPLPDYVTISRASSATELLEAYRLVYALFLQEGYISKNKMGVRMRVFEAMPETATFVAKVDGEIVGVTSIVIDSPLVGLPGEKAFKNEIGALRRNNRLFCEGTNWVILPDYRQTNIMSNLMRCCYAYAVSKHCQDMFAVVSPKHDAYYELIRFQRVGSVRNSSPDIIDPVVLERNNLDNFYDRLTNLELENDSDDAVLRDFYLVNNPYHDVMEEWTVQAETNFYNPDFLRELFVDATHFLDHCNPRDLALIQKRWGNSLYLDVRGHQLICNEFAISA